jgi:hypothetical protein
VTATGEDVNTGAEQVVSVDMYTFHVIDPDGESPPLKVAESLIACPAVPEPAVVAIVGLALDTAACSVESLHAVVVPAFHESPE